MTEQDKDANPKDADELKQEWAESDPTISESKKCPECGEPVEDLPDVDIPASKEEAAK